MLKHVLNKNLIKLASRTTDFLDLMPKCGRIAEIGVFKADYSRIIYDKCNPKELHLIDVWDCSTCSNDSIDTDDYKNYFSKKYSKNERFLFCEKAKLKFPNNERVFFHKEYSCDAVKKFPDGFFDWVYIDADHDYESIKNDLELWNKKVKYRGYMCGHDYSPKISGVIRAVNEFMIRHNWTMKYITCDDYPSWAIEKT